MKERLKRTTAWPDQRPLPDQVCQRLLSDSPTTQAISAVLGAGVTCHTAASCHHHQCEPAQGLAGTASLPKGVSKGTAVPVQGGAVVPLRGGSFERPAVTLSSQGSDSMTEFKTFSDNDTQTGKEVRSPEQSVLSFCHSSAMDLKTQGSPGLAPPTHPAHAEGGFLRQRGTYCAATEARLGCGFPQILRPPSGEPGILSWEGACSSGCSTSWDPRL